MYICQLKIDGARGLYGGEEKQKQGSERKPEGKIPRRGPKMRGICQLSDKVLLRLNRTMLYGVSQVVSDLFGRLVGWLLGWYVRSFVIYVSIQYGS